MRNRTLFFNNSNQAYSKNKEKSWKSRRPNNLKLSLFQSTRHPGQNPAGNRIGLLGSGRTYSVALNSVSLRLSITEKNSRNWQLRRLQVMKRIDNGPVGTFMTAPPYVSISRVSRAMLANNNENGRWCTADCDTALVQSRSSHEKKRTLSGHQATTGPPRYRIKSKRKTTALKWIDNIRADFFRSGFNIVGSCIRDLLKIDVLGDLLCITWAASVCVATSSSSSEH